MWKHSFSFQIHKNTLQEMVENSMKIIQYLTFFYDVCVYQCFSFNWFRVKKTDYYQSILSEYFPLMCVIFVMLLSTEAVVQRCSVKKMFSKISRNSQENSVPESLFNKVAGLRPATLLKTGHWHGYFPVSFAKFRTFFYRTPPMAASASIFSTTSVL